MRINRKAPLYSKKQIEISAPLKRVWSIQSEINSWPKWQKSVSKANLRGKLKEGTTFEWKVMGMVIYSKLGTVEKEKKIGWTGVSLGMQAEHIFYFEKKNSKTKVVTEESLSGWLPRLIKIFMPSFLDNSLKDSLKALKSTAESK